jgi:hypothetical protein
MYIYKPDNTTEYVTVTINGATYTYSSLKTDNRIIDAGYVTDTDTVVVGGEPASSYKIYILDEDKYLAAYEKLNSNSFIVDDYTTTTFTGTISTSNDGTFMFSIPYDKGWSLYIDGKKCETYAAFDALLAADITAGEHTVKLKYTPVNYILGCIVSILCIIILVAVYLLKRFKYREILECSKLPPLLVDMLNNDDVLTPRVMREDTESDELEEMDDFDNIELNNELLEEEFENEISDIENNDGTSN